MGIFKAYDIRGKFPEEINETVAYDVSEILPEIFDFDCVVIAHDGRGSSPKIAEAMCYSLLKNNKKVIMLGLTTTPLLYFATGRLDVDLGIMITASHNPREFNGIKFCRRNAVPVSYDDGINAIEKKFNDSSRTLSFDDVKKEFFSDFSGRLSNLRYENLVDEYANFVVSSFSGNLNRENMRKLKVAIDAGNGVGGYVLSKILGRIDFVSVLPLFFEVDGDFPNHQANPLEVDTLSYLSEAVKKNGCDLGIAIDGDGDRIGAVDENGDFVQPDLLSAFFSDHILSDMKEKGNLSDKSTIVYDLRSTMAVKEVIESYGANAIKSRVGHSYIKKIMRDNNAVFAGELSGHFYFRFNSKMYFDSGIKALLELLVFFSGSSEKFSESIKRYRKYFQSGEINFDVSDKNKVISEVKNHFKELESEDLDGLSVYGNSFWFNLRMSNTENKLRLNLEADTKDKLDLMVSEVSKIILGN